MKQWTIMVGVLCAIVGWPGAGAAEELKVGFIDAQIVLDRSAVGKESKEQLEAYVKSRQQVIDVDETELRRLEEELKTQAAVLSEEALREKQETLQRKMIAYQKRAGEMSQEVQERRAEVLQGFNGYLKRAVKRVAEQEGYAYVLDKEAEGGSVLFAAERYDLTEKVVAEMARAREKP